MRYTEPIVSFHQALIHVMYSGTLLNGHPSTVDTPDITLKVPTVPPFTSATPLLRITESFCGPNCTQTILNDLDLVDTRPFQQDCPPSLLVTLD